MFSKVLKYFQMVIIQCLSKNEGTIHLVFLQTEDIRLPLFNFANQQQWLKNATLGKVYILVCLQYRAQGLVADASQLIMGASWYSHG